MAKLIGTAGHVDHGKTTLIQALSGIDADRLPEEKKRGMTIDIGFAYVDLPKSGRASIVDVPGHEKFLTNMLVGALGIDVALLCVAADAGVMPQTREHLQILELLPVNDLIVALTRSDLVDEETLELATLDVNEFLDSTRFKGAPIIPVSAAAGTGVAELLAALDDVLSRPAVEATGPWYMPIDRVFSVKGHGAVVTGTLAQGKVRPGDSATIQPGNLQARVRTIHSHEESLEFGECGRRIALNLNGVKTEELRRGMLIGKPGAVFETSLFDAVVRTVGDIKHAMRVRVSVGAEEAIGKVFLNDSDKSLVQVRTEEPLACALKQPVIIRRYSPPDVLAGGRITVPHAQPRKKSQEVRSISSELDPKEAILETLAVEPMGLDTAEVCRRVGRSAQELGAVFEDLIKENRTLGFAGLWFVPHQFESSAAKFEAALDKLHSEKPAMGHIPREAVVAAAGLKWGGKPLDRIVTHLVQTGRLAAQGTGIRLSSFEIRLSDKQEAFLSRVIALLDAEEVNVPNVKELAARVPAPTQAIEEILKLGVSAGRIVRIEDTIYYSKSSLKSIADGIRAQFGESGFTAAECRDLWQSSRKYVIPLLEYFDSIGFTVRVGDQRMVKKWES